MGTYTGLPSYNRNRNFNAEQVSIGTLTEFSVPQNGEVSLYFYRILRPTLYSNRLQRLT